MKYIVGVRVVCWDRSCTMKVYSASSCGLVGNVGHSVCI